MRRVLAAVLAHSAQPRRGRTAEVNGRGRQRMGASPRSFSRVTESWPSRGGPGCTRRGLVKGPASSLTHEGARRSTRGHADPRGGTPIPMALAMLACSQMSPRSDRLEKPSLHRARRRRKRLSLVRSVPPRRSPLLSRPSDPPRVRPPLRQANGQMTHTHTPHKHKQADPRARRTDRARHPSEHTRMLCVCRRRLTRTQPRVTPTSAPTDKRTGTHAHTSARVCFTPFSTLLNECTRHASPHTFHDPRIRSHAPPAHG